MVGRKGPKEEIEMSRQEQWDKEREAKQKKEAARVKAIREQQLKDATVLLLLIQDALAEMDFSVTVHVDRLDRMVWGRTTIQDREEEKAILQVCDYWVPEFSIRPADASYRSKSSDEGKLEVVVDGVYYPYHIKRKTFARSKARAETFGFDVQAIAKHLVAFVTEKWAIEKQRELHENSIEMWRKVCERLAVEFPEADIVPTGGGIRLAAVVGEREARAALQAIYRVKTKSEEPEKGKSK